jgi:hypothetical protein
MGVSYVVSAAKNSVELRSHMQHTQSMVQYAKDMFFR